MATIDDFVRYGGSDIARRLRSRAQVAREAQKDDRRLDLIDRLLLAPCGEQIVDTIYTADENQRFNLGSPEVTVAWAVILDELVQKTAATGRRVEQVVIEEPVPTSWLHRVARSPQRRSFRQAIQVTRLTPSPTPEFSTTYLDELGFVEWSDKRIDNDILALNTARVNIERELGFPAPEEWTVPDGIPPRVRGRFSAPYESLRLYVSVEKRLNTICGREYGQDFLSVKQNDRTAGLRALHQAIQEGLLHLADELAQSLLKSERPEVDGVSIGAHIAYAERMAASARDALGQRQPEDDVPELEQAVQGWQDQVAALSRWRSIGQGPYYEQLMDMCFSQRYRSRFASGALAKVSANTGGSMTGGDLLRELVFTVAAEGKAWWMDRANRDLARRMLSDEAIARAITRGFSRGTGLPDTSVGGEERLRQVLPALDDATHFQIGDVLRIVVHAGIQTAARGEPYLTGRDGMV